MYVATAAALALVWELAARSSSTVRFLISSPSLAANFGAENYAALLNALAMTSFESIAGLLVATIFGSGSMIACLFWEPLRRWIEPPIVASQVVPLVSLAPFFIIAFGFGPSSKVAMAATICFFPIFVNLASGVKSIPTAVTDLAFVYGLRPSRQIFGVLLPLATPSLFSGLKIAATLSVIGAIVAEFNGAETGLGKNLYLAARRLEPELMICSLALASLVGGVLYYTIAVLERRFGFWYLNQSSMLDKKETP